MPATNSFFFVFGTFSGAVWLFKLFLFKSFFLFKSNDIFGGGKKVPSSSRKVQSFKAHTDMYVIRRTPGRGER